MTTYTFNIETIKKAIGSIEGKNPNEIKGLLVTKGKVPFNQVPKVYKALGLTATRESYVADFYALLENGVMDDKAFATWIGAQSDNGQKHKGHFDKIRLMANAIWAAKAK